MAGLWQLSFVQQLDANGVPIVGARAFFYRPGTTTPLTVYKDAALTVAHTAPLFSDGAGRFPAVFLDPDETTTFRHRVATPDASAVIFDTDGLPIVSETTSSGGDGGTTPVGAAGNLKTGDCLWTPTKGFRDGYVRCNGRTIGNALSGASERANDDTQALFEFLWGVGADAEDAGVDDIFALVGGRGTSAVNDWAANKQITLPDMRGKAPFGLDSMGYTAAGLIDGDGADVAGYSGGEAEHTLTLEELPEHDHGGQTQTAGAHLHKGGVGDAGSSTFVYGATGEDMPGKSFGRIDKADGGAGSLQGFTSTDGDHTHKITPAGEGEAHNNMPPFVLGTWYQKL